MSKLSFRARALDAAKPLPVYRNRDVPDLTDCVSINRAVPQMPTGMEKEEELVRTCFNLKYVSGGALARCYGRIHDALTYSSVRTLCSSSGPNTLMYAGYVLVTYSVRC